MAMPFLKDGAYGTMRIPMPIIIRILIAFFNDMDYVRGYSLMDEPVRLGGVH